MSRFSIRESSNQVNRIAEVGLTPIFNANQLYGTIIRSDITGASEGNILIFEGNGWTSSNSGNFTVDGLTVSSGTLTLNNIVLSNDDVATSTLDISKATSDVHTQVTAGDTFTPNITLKEDTSNGDRWTIKKSPTVSGDNALVINENKDSVSTDRLTVTGGNFDFQDGDLTTTGNITAGSFNSNLYMVGERLGVNISNPSYHIEAQTSVGNCGFRFKTANGNFTEVYNVSNTHASVANYTIFGSSTNKPTQFNTNLITKHVLPVDANQEIGSEALPYNKIYSANTLQVISDSRYKKDVTNLSDSDTLGWVTSLQPVSYKWVDETNDTKVHLGLLAQDVKTVLDNNGFVNHGLVSYAEWGDIRGTTDGENDVLIKEAGNKYMLSYSELISPLISCIKQLKTELDDCKSRLTTLESA